MAELRSSDPVPGLPDLEAVLGRHIARRGIFVGPPLLVLFGVIGGWRGMWSAAIGLAIVAGNFLLSGALLSLAARLSLSLYHAAALFGFFLRLGLITLTMVIVVRLGDVDRLAFGITVVASYLALLTWEAATMAHRAEKELDWTR